MLENFLLEVEMLSETLVIPERPSSCSNRDASDLFFSFCFVCTCDPQDFDHIRQESEVVINGDDQEHGLHLLAAAARLICAQSRPARWRADTGDLIHWYFLRVGWR